MSAPDRRAMLDRADKSLSVRRQCALVGVARSGVYRARKPANDNDGALMRRIDELFTAWPFLGSRRMTAMLRAEGVNVNRKRVQRLMRLMGIAALGPKPKTSKPAPGHRIYPYLLRNLAIERANHVWAADITYIPIGRGFLYLVAIIDWASRAVLAWRLSNTMDVSFCLAALEEARAKFGKPEIFNTTKARSSLRRPSPARSPKRASRSPWTAAAAGWTTSSSNGCGGPSSMRTSISKATPTAAKPRVASLLGSPSTTSGARTRRWPTAHRWRSGARQPPASRLWT